MTSRLRKNKRKPGFSVKLRFGEKLSRDEWFFLDVEQEPQAEDRLKRLQRMAKLLSELCDGNRARLYLEEAAAERHERGFAAIEKRVEGLSPVAAPEKAPMTFRKVVNLLTSGELHDLYPDDVKFKSAPSLDNTRTQLAVFLPALGDKTFDAITKAHINEAKLLIPKDLETSTRIRYLRELRRVMRLAIHPLELVEQTPVVTIPLPPARKLYTFVYPIEEALVLRAVEIPFEIRFLYAFLSRNGGRITETLQYRWDHIDLDSGVIHVDAEWTKMKKARYWDLAPDVLEALQLRRKQIPDAELVFVPPPGMKKLTRRYILSRLLNDLQLAGLTRRELFVTTSGARRLRVHDWGRASFVTVARACGMSDRWIMDRSGHESALEFEKYDRGIRHVQERNLGYFAPMSAALGMVAVPGQVRAKPPKTSTKEQILSIPYGVPPYPPPPVNPANLGGRLPLMAGNAPFGPAGFPGSGQRPQLTTEHLAELLGLAQKAKRWHLVKALGEALEEAERVREQAHPKVTDIATARRKREEDR